MGIGNGTHFLINYNNVTPTAFYSVGHKRPL